MTSRQTTPRSLGSRLLEARLARGLTQGQLSIRLGVSRQAVSKWEHDRSQPDLENLQKLAELYGTTVDALLDEPAAPGGDAVAGMTPSEGARIMRDRKLICSYTLLSGAFMGIGFVLVDIVGTDRAGDPDAPYLAFALLAATLLICVKLFGHAQEYYRRGGSRILLALQLATIALVFPAPLFLGAAPLAMGACAIAAVLCSVCASRVVAWRLLYQRDWDIREDLRDPLGRIWHAER